MKILNIHGYGGSAENSACLALKELGHDVISPQIDYDAESSENIFGDIKKAVEENKPDHIVGTSLGGFFALLTAIRFNIPAALVNPCLMPFATLSELGYDGDISGFIRLFGNFADIRQENTAVIIGGRDEIVSYHDTVTRKLIENCTVIPDGKHSGATLPLKDYFGEVIK